MPSLLVVDYATLCVARAKRGFEIEQENIQIIPQTYSDEQGKLVGSGSGKFSSEEHYTPVYDGQLSKLEPLDFNVVTHVTEFYTYRKTMVDYLRAIGAAKNVQESTKLMREMIYMQFLMYESARLAIEELIEFQPNRAESLVSILCSELVVFEFLSIRHEKDYRGERLRLRRKQYQEKIPKLYYMIKDKHDQNWEKALATLPELMKRYMNLCATLHLEPKVTVGSRGPAWT